MSLRRLALGVALVSSVACAGGEEPPGALAPRDGSAGQAAAATGEPQDARRERIDPRRGGLDLGFGEFAITMEADQIRPGPVTFVIRNQGTMVHGFEIEIEGVDEDNSGPGGGGDDDGFKFEGEPL